MIKISDEYNIPIFFIVDNNDMPEGNKMFIPTKEICYIYIAENINKHIEISFMTYYH